MYVYYSLHVLFNCVAKLTCVVIIVKQENISGNDMDKNETALLMKSIPQFEIVDSHF